MTDTRHTAPAAISFTCLITGSIDLVMESDSFSMVVFIISSPNTSAEQKSIASHSVGDIRKAIPKRKVIAAMSSWIRKFFSKTEQCFIPSSAYLKDFRNRIVNYFGQYDYKLFNKKIQLLNFILPGTIELYYRMK